MEGDAHLLNKNMGGLTIFKEGILTTLHKTYFEYNVSETKQCGRL